MHAKERDIDTDDRGGGQPRLDCLDLADQRVCRETFPSPPGYRRAFWTLTMVFLLGMAGGTLPSPLYPLYQDAFGFSNALVTVVFAFYGAGVLVSLVGLGRASDRAGRKTMLLAALGFAVLSTVSFILAQGLPLLFAGRFLSGLGIGILTGTATAGLAELEPTGNRRTASIVSGIVTPGGLALGAILTGIAIDFGPLPMRLIFAIYLVLVAILVAGVLSLPETVPASNRRRALALQRLHVPGEMRAVFVFCAAGVFSAFGMMGLFASLVPSFLAQALDQSSSLLSGSALLLVFGAAAVAPPTIGRLPIGSAARWGLVAATGGLTLFVVGLTWALIAPLVVGCAMAGFGSGCLFVSTLALINRDAPPDRRGEVVSAYFVAGYAGVTLLPIGAGFGSVGLGAVPSVLIACAVIVGLAAFAQFGVRRSM